MADDLKQIQVGGTTFRCTPEGEAKVRKSPKGIGMPAKFGAKLVPPGTPKPPVDESREAYLARLAALIAKTRGNDERCVDAEGGRAGKFTVSVTDGHRAILTRDKASKDRKFPRLGTCGEDWIALTPELWSAVRRVSVLAPEKGRADAGAVELTLTPGDGANVRVAVYTMTPEYSALETVTVSGHLTQARRVRVSAFYLLPLFGLDGMRLYVEDNATQVVARLRTDTFRVLVMPFASETEWADIMLASPVPAEAVGEAPQEAPADVPLAGQEAAAAVPAFAVGDVVRLRTGQPWTATVIGTEHPKGRVGLVRLHWPGRDVRIWERAAKFALAGGATT